MTLDALQCGFCTPGFVVEAVAFYENWRKTKGAVATTREEIGSALSGHLCRCGAYENTRMHSSRPRSTLALRTASAAVRMGAIDLD